MEIDTALCRAGLPVIYTRLLGLVEPFIWQVIFGRILSFERDATLIVVMAIITAPDPRKLDGTWGGVTKSLAGLLRITQSATVGCSTERRGHVVGRSQKSVALSVYHDDCWH